jgi:hypothetical protein
MREELRIKLRSLRSLKDGNENRGQLFALTRVLRNARPFGLPVYVAPLPAGSILVVKVPAFPRFQYMVI